MLFATEPVLTREDTIFTQTLKGSKTSAMTTVPDLANVTKIKDIMGRVLAIKIGRGARSKWKNKL